VNALGNSNLHERVGGGAGSALRLANGAKFEMALLGLLLLTAGAVIWQRPILERTIRFTPQVVAAKSHKLFSDQDAGGGSRTSARGPFSWECELRPGNAYPYCGYELFVDRDRGIT